MEKFDDIKAIIFDGCLTETIKFDDFVVIIRTLSPAEETFVIETYKNLPNDYNLLGATDTIQRAIYSINGCKIKDEFRERVKDWPKQIIIKIFDHYLALVNRSRDAADLINEFVKTDDSKLRWSVLKTTKTSLNSATITGNPEFEEKGLSYLQQVWIFLNQQEDLVAENKLDWARVEYMTDSICAFVNPKAMRQIQNRKKLEEEERLQREQRVEINKDAKGHVMIENTADELFDALEKKQDETILDRNNRVQKILVKAFSEDEHDRIVREHEEYQFYRELRIKKENIRRAKILHAKRMSNVTVINLPEAPKGIQVGYMQVSTLGDDIDDTVIAKQEAKNPHFINGVDYSDIVSITSFNMLKNRDTILNEVANESEEITTGWIDKYIEEESRQKTEVMKIIKALQANADGIDIKEKVLNMRENVLSGKMKNKYENEQEDMKASIKRQNDSDEIYMGGKE